MTAENPPSDTVRPRLTRRHPSLQRLDSAFSAGILPLLLRRRSSDDDDERAAPVPMTISTPDSGSGGGGSVASSLASPTFSYSSAASTATSRSGSGISAISARKPNISTVSAATFATLLSGPIVTVTVGSNTTEAPRTWSLHRGLLAYHSPFFAARFGSTSNERVRAYTQDVSSSSSSKDEDGKNKGSDNSNEREKAKDKESPSPASSVPQTPTKPPKPPKLSHQRHPRHDEPLELSLPDDSPAAFELLVKWLYQGSIDDDTPSEDATTTLAEAKWNHALRCQNLHFLCSRLGLSSLRDLSLDHFRRSCFEAGLVPGPEEMAPVYARTAPGSPFRKLVSSIAARQMMDPAADANAETYRSCFEADAGFAIDVVNAIRKGLGGKLLQDPTEGWNGCEWHEHEEGETCEIKKGSGILKKKVKWRE